MGYSSKVIVDKKKIKPQWCKVVRDYADHKIVLIKDLPNQTEIEDKPGLAISWFRGHWSPYYRVVYKNINNEWLELGTEQKDGRFVVKYIPWHGLAWDILQR